MRFQSTFNSFHPELFQVKSKSEKEQFRPYVFLSSCAVASAGTIAAILTAVPRSQDHMAVFDLCAFPTQRQLPPLRTEKAVFVLVVTHVLNSAYLLLECAFSLSAFVFRLRNTTSAIC